MARLPKVAGAQPIAQRQLGHAVPALEEPAEGHQYVEVQHAQQRAGPQQDQVVDGLPEAPPGAMSDSACADRASPVAGTLVTTIVSRYVSFPHMQEPFLES